MTQEKDERPQPPSGDGDPDEGRLQKYLAMLPDFLNKIEADHPDWDRDATYWILNWALKRLRDYIEDDNEPAITWETPYLELQYPVTCEWHRDDPDASSFSVISGTLTEEDVVDDDSASKAFSELLIRHLEIEALHGLTNHVAFEMRGDSCVKIVPEALGEALMKIDDKQERERELRKLFRPRSFGAGSVDYGDMEEGTPVGPEALAQIAEIEEPLIAVPLDVDGHPIRVIAIFEVHPLEADTEAERAKFRIVTGLAIQSNAEQPPDESWLEQPWTSLSNWESRDRDALWTLIENALEESITILDKNPELEEATISVHAEIKIKIPKDDPEALRQLQHQTLSALQNAGEVVELELRHDTKALAEEDQKQHLRSLLDSVLEAKSNDDKGKSLESLMSALFQSIPGFSVLENVRTQTEEIDLWIENENSGGPFGKEGALILAECKNWRTKCGKDEFVLLQKKAENRGSRCTIAFLISWNGFADTITKEMLRGSKEHLRVVPLAGDAIVSAIEDGDFIECLRTARHRALKK